VLLVWVKHFGNNVHLCVQNRCACSVQDHHQFHNKSAAIFRGICKAFEKNDDGVVMSICISACKSETPTA
jgi:hypothetical protein